ncbi:MAG: 4Fe-4S dicluster domain-containing protein [bacterium]|jgi:ferredoxin
MKPRHLNPEELNQLLDHLAQETCVYAPVKDRTGARWERIKSSADVWLQEVNTAEPAKGFIFPRCEIMLKFDPDGNPVEPEPPAELLLFGIRPCDARAIEILKKFFIGEDRTDPYVRARAEKVTLIGVACNRTAPTCFCLGLGGSPHATTGLDLLLVELGTGYLAQPVTEKGEKLVTTFPPAAERDLETARHLRHQAEAEITTRIDTRTLKEKLPAAYDRPVWQQLALNCINCGVCTFLCPTCHCFDITDETVRGKTVRYRVWDSCQFTLYSRHASGHNPRLDPAARYRNRVMDKFYYTVEQIGEISCVGCGRCIHYCPAGIDIRQTVEQISTETEKTKL